MNKTEMTQNTNVKIDRFDFIEIKFSYLLKDTTINRQASGWGKISATVKTNKGSACKTYKELLQINKKMVNLKNF